MDNETNIRTYYDHLYQETLRYRTYEWQIAVWAASILAVASTAPKILCDCNNFTSGLKVILIISTSIMALAAIYFILHCHKALTFNRKQIWRIEKHFKLFKIKLNPCHDPVIPKEATKEPTYSRGAEYLIFWILLILSMLTFTIIQIAKCTCP